MLFRSQEGTGVQEEENFTDIISDIIVNTDTETAAKVIEEINDIDTDTNLSLEVISGISEKDSEVLNELTESIEDEINELAEDAIQKAENTSEDSQLIANVVSVVSDDLVNVMVEEVSKTSTDEKQTLSAKVLQAIVDTEPSKIDIIDNDVKDTMIEQTIESAKNQQAGHEFDKMRKRIERHLNQRTEMLSGISHDLRTPLTRMKLQLAFIKDKETVNKFTEICN